MTASAAARARSARAVLPWAALAVAIGVPFAFSVASPLLAWRDPVYILAGFAGVAGLALMLVQPLLIGGYLPGLTPYQSRCIHRWTGVALVVMVIVHVAGLWVTSPPDVVDALLLRSPTPFSAWGVIAMWAIFCVAAMVALRHRLGMRPRTWRRAHTVLVVLIVATTVVHSILIVGTMETVTKAALCALVIAATIKVIADRRIWRPVPAIRGGTSELTPG